MPLQSGSSATEPQYNMGREFAPGAYVQEGVIHHAVDINAAEIPFNIDGKIGCVVYFEIGRDFYPEVLVMGTPAMDSQTKAITGWGPGAKHVDNLFTNVGGFGGVVVKDNGEITPEALASLAGKRCKYVKYIRGLGDDGKKKYNIWGRLYGLNQDEEALIADFKRTYDEGYVPKYAPALASQPSNGGTQAQTAHAADELGL